MLLFKAATGAKTPWWCAEEATDLREAVRKVAESRRVICFWVPSHGGVRGNEVADRLARRGATGVDSDEEASPEDQFTIPKEDLVVTAVLGMKDVRAWWLWMVSVQNLFLLHLVHLYFFLYLIHH